MFGNSVSREQYEDMKARAERAEAREAQIREAYDKLVQQVVTMRRRHQMDPVSPVKPPHLPEPLRRTDGQIVADRERAFVESVVEELVGQGHSRTAAEQEAQRLRRAATATADEGDM